MSSGKSIGVVGVVAARGRAVDETEAVDRRETRELMDNVLLRNGRLTSPSSLSSSISCQKRNENA